MGWVYVIIAGILEIFWVMGLKYANSIFLYAGVAIIITISFYTLMKAYKYLPVSVSYAVFTGIGTLGILIIEIIRGNTLVSAIKIIFVLMILCGVIGLKLTTKEH